MYDTQGVRGKINEIARTVKLLNILKRNIGHQKVLSFETTFFIFDILKFSIVFIVVILMIINYYIYISNLIKNSQHLIRYIVKNLLSL